MRAAISGWGTALPDQRLTNADLEQLVETSDQWIVERTGIRERRIAMPGESTATLAIEAGAAAIKNAGCEFRTYPALPRTPHYVTLNPSPPPSWNSVPPTSGRHYYQPLIFGIYTEPVPEIRAVHNLEHGAVILQYGDKVSASDVAKITAWSRKDANAVLVAPLPKLGAKTALTAWTRWTECTGFNEKAANAFRSAFRYQAPEKFPPSYLNPGE